MLISEEEIRKKVCPFMSKPSMPIGMLPSSPGTVKCMGSDCAAWSGGWEAEGGKPMGRCVLLQDKKG